MGDGRLRGSGGERGGHRWSERENSGVTGARRVVAGVGVLGIEEQVSVVK